MTQNHKPNLIDKVLISHPNCLYCGIKLVHYPKNRIITKITPDDMAVCYRDKTTGKRTVMCVNCCTKEAAAWAKENGVNDAGINYSNPLPINGKTRKELDQILEIYRAKIDFILNKYNVDNEDRQHIKKIFSNIGAANYYSRTGKFLHSK